jgi:hypothetical protein
MFHTPEAVVQSNHIDTVTVIMKIAQEQAGVTIPLLGNLAHPSHEIPAVLVMSN